MNLANRALSEVPPQEIYGGEEGGCQITYLNSDGLIVTGWARSLGAAIQHARWVTYSKSGEEPISWPLLRECSTEHLESILNTQNQVYTALDGSSYERIIKAILKLRQQD